MSHPFTDRHGYPLTSVQALRYMRHKRLPTYVDGKPVWPAKAPLNEGKRPASRLVKPKPIK